MSMTCNNFHYGEKEKIQRKETGEYSTVRENIFKTIKIISELESIRFVVLSALFAQFRDAIGNGKKRDEARAEERRHGKLWKEGMMQ